MGDRCWIELEEALSRQEDALKKGRWSGFERAMEDAEEILKSCQRSLSPPDQPQVDRLRQLYDRLMLLAQTHKAQINEQLNTVRRKRSLAGTYSR